MQTITRVFTDPGAEPLVSRLAPAFAALVPCTSLSKIVALVSSKIPLAPTLLHLKRVRREAGSKTALVLLAFCDDERLIHHEANGRLQLCSSDPALQCSLCSIPDLATLFIGDVCVLDLPKVAPSDMADFTKESAEVWPLARHPNVRVRFSPIDPDTRAYFLAGAEAARALASSSSGGAEACVIASPPSCGCEKKTAEPNSWFSVYSASAAPTDPCDLSGHGSSRASWHPFASCVMLAIDQLAAQDRCRRRKYSLVMEPSRDSDADLASCGHKRVRSQLTAQSVGPVSSAHCAAPRLEAASSTAQLTAMWCESSALAANAAETSLPGLAEAECSAWEKLNPRPVKVARIAFDLSTSTCEAGETTTEELLCCCGIPSAARYLATGMDAFLTREPDVFEAMALVHSRVSRVIYCVPNTGRGALGSAEQSLHEVRSLNHHYEVFRVDLGTAGAPAHASSDSSAH